MNLGQFKLSICFAQFEFYTQQKLWLMAWGPRSKVNEVTSVTQCFKWKAGSSLHFSHSTRAGGGCGFVLECTDHSADTQEPDSCPKSEKLLLGGEH